MLSPQAAHGAETPATTSHTPLIQTSASQANATTDGAQEIIALEEDKTVEREIAGGQTQQFQIKATTGEFVGVRVGQRGVDVSERLFAPDGKLAAAFDDEVRPREEEYANFVAETTGVYRLEVTATAKNATGSYEIRLTERREAAERERQVYEARKLSTEASLLNRAGKYEAARTLAARALEVGEKALGRDHVYVAYLLNQLGHIQRSRGQSANAEASFQRALEINEKALGLEHPQTVESIRGLGLVARSRNDFAKAGPLFEKALAITEKTLGAEHPRVAVCLLDLGAFHVDMDDLAGGVRDDERALAIAERTLEPDDLLTARVLNNLGNLYRIRNDSQRGEPMLRRALAIYEKTLGADHPFVADTLQNLGIIARERKDYARALEMYQRALAIREQALGAEHPNVAALINNIANLHHAQGDYATELELQARVLSVAEKTVGPYHGLTLTSLANTARAYAAEGDMTNALKFQTLLDERGEIAIASDLTIGSERQKLAYIDSLSEDTSRTISFNLDLAPHAGAARALAALVLLERKGRVLDAISDSMTALRQRAKPEDQQLLDQLNSVAADLAKLVLNGLQKRALDDYQKQIAAREEEKERLEAEISARSAEFRAQSQPVTLAAVQAAIPRRAALVEFAIYRPYDPKAVSDAEAYGKPRYVAYVLRGQGEAQGLELGEAQAIDARVDALRQALLDPQRRDVQQLARAVDEQVMRPLRSFLGDATQLLLSPDGELNLLPFQALVDEQGHYLIERYAFTYLTSGRDLLRMQVARASKSEPLVIANPTFGETAAERKVNTPAKWAEPNVRRRSVAAARTLSELYFAPLDGTAEEADAIRKIFPDANLLTGARATKSALKQAVAPRILHIATHGFFLQAPPTVTDGRAQLATVKTRGADVAAESENPLLRSGLALAGANRRGGAADDDGILTALEASGLNLWGTKLVVLSACDTGLGEVRNGEGVYGLRRAFVLAGAESLVLSLWPASDYSTRTLMTSYYKNLKQGLGRGEALRRVQLDMLRRSPQLHPFYWANFIQSGEWANLDGKR
jgi:CHAT domain-containing protein/Tfp pilus assembly protein PilF